MPAWSQADVYPARPVNLIVPWPPGGSQDTLGRLAAEKMASLIGQPIVVENRGGAAGRIGTAAAAKAAPNGYTLALIGSGTHVISAAVDKDLAYDPIADFIPFMQIGEFPLLLVARADLPAANLRELIATARKNPGKITIGSAGPGSASHLTGELFKHRAGIFMLYLHYRGEGPLMTDLMAGRIDLTILSFGTDQYIRQGKVKALATTRLKRWSIMPDVPTMDEQGLKGFNTGGWTGLAVPARTPAPIVTKLASVGRSALEAEDLRKRLVSMGVEPGSRTPAEILAMMKADVGMWKKLIADSGLNIQAD